MALSEGLLADPLRRRRIEFREARAGHGFSESGARSVGSGVVFREKKVSRFGLSGLCFLLCLGGWVGGWVGYNL